MKLRLKIDMNSDQFTFDMSNQITKTSIFLRAQFSIKNNNVQKLLPKHYLWIVLKVLHDDHINFFGNIT